GARRTGAAIRQTRTRCAGAVVDGVHAEPEASRVHGLSKAERISRSALESEGGERFLRLSPAPQDTLRTSCRFGCELSAHCSEVRLTDRRGWWDGSNSAADAHPDWRSLRQPLRCGDEILILFVVEHQSHRLVDVARWFVDVGSRLLSAHDGKRSLVLFGRKFQVVDNACQALGRLGTKGNAGARGRCRIDERVDLHEIKSAIRILVAARDESLHP